jgi:MFS family permease
MSQKIETIGRVDAVQDASWAFLVVIILAQVQMAFNISALQVSIGPIVEDLDTPATSIGTALVVYSLSVAAFVLLGAKIGKMFGGRLVFQVSALLHGGSMVMMALSTNARMMYISQGLSGLAAAALVPTLVVLIAAHYQGRQQEQALGLIAGSVAMAGSAAFFLAGFLATSVSWRISFGMLGAVSIVVFLLSFRLKSLPRQSGIKVDMVGAILAAVAVALISFGFNGLHSWGVFLANADAPFNLLGLSPAPFMIVLGIVFGQAFFVWSYKRQRAGKTPLLSLEVLDSRHERAATYALLIISALGPAVYSYLIPLYIQIVQGRTSLQTAVEVVPYTLTVFVAAALIVRLYDRFSPRQIGSVAFVIVAAGLVLVAYTIQNDWGTPLVIVSLIIVGAGEGALLALVFNVLVSSSPRELAGDVGAMRGVAMALSSSAKVLSMCSNTGYTASSRSPLGALTYRS